MKQPQRNCIYYTFKFIALLSIGYCVYTNIEILYIYISDGVHIVVDNIYVLSNKQ